MKLEIPENLHLLVKQLAKQSPKMYVQKLHKTKTKIPFPARCMHGYVIGGIGLQSKLEVTAISVSALRELYESYLEKFFVKGTRDPQAERQMLKKALKIPNQNIESWYLADELFEWEGGVLACLAALVANKIEEPMTGSVVNARAIKLGVDVEGKVYSARYTDIKVQPQDYHALLHAESNYTETKSRALGTFYRYLLSKGGTRIGKNNVKAFLVLNQIMTEAEICLGLCGHTEQFNLISRLNRREDSFPDEGLAKFEEAIKETWDRSNPIPKMWKDLVYEGRVSPRDFIAIVYNHVLYLDLSHMAIINEDVRNEWLKRITKLRNKHDSTQRLYRSSLRSHENQQAV